jgi:hypothetical protein
MFEQQQQSQGVIYFQTQNLAQLPGLKHGFSSRVGGISEGPFASLNLKYPAEPAEKAGETHTQVAENRRRIATAIGFEAEAVVACPVPPFKPSQPVIGGEAPTTTGRPFRPPMA